MKDIDPGTFQIYARSMLIPDTAMLYPDAYQKMIRDMADDLRKWLTRTGHEIHGDADVTVTTEPMPGFGTARATVEFRATAGAWSEVDDVVLRDCGEWPENTPRGRVWYRDDDVENLKDLGSWKRP